MAASINQIPIKRALVDTNASIYLIPLSTLRVAGISERKIQRCLMEVTAFGRGASTCRPYLVVVESRPHSFFSSVPCDENRGLLSCAFREVVVAQTLMGLVHLSLVCERKIEWQDDTHRSKPLFIRTSRGSFSRNYVLRPMGFVWGKLSIKAMRYLRA